jgi:ABC-type polysaccharide/polyol phosphate export permease
MSDFPLFVLCGLIPFNFFVLAWSTATSSLVDNAAVIKRVAVPREAIPIATVLANCLHLLIQIGLLIALTLAFGKGINRHWVWLPYVWGMEILFVCGLSLITSAVNIYIRDTRYIVDSFNALLFWLVPIFYSFAEIPERYAKIVDLNPVAALVMSLRNILMDHIAPATSLLVKLSCASLIVLAAGVLIFHRLKRDFYDYL